MKRTDIIVGLFLIFGSALVFFEAGTYANKGVQQTFYGPPLFPQILSILIVLCCALLIFNALRGKSLRRAERIDRQGFLRLLVSLFIAVIYWASIDFFGFLLATPVFLFALMTQLGARNWVTRVAVAILTPLVIWWLFEKVLVVQLPEGELKYMVFGE